MLCARIFAAGGFMLRRPLYLIIGLGPGRRRGLLAGAMDFFQKKYPDILLLASNLAVLFLSGGDARVFLITIVAAITLRYLLLSALIFLDWRRPGWFAGSRLRRLTRDPDEGGAYAGGGAETPVLGHFVFLALFNFIPLMFLMDMFKAMPIAGNIPYIIWTAIAVELRDIAAGRVIYFRSGAGQRRNASWNFKHLLTLAVTLILLPGVLLVGGVAVMILHGLSTLLGWPQLVPPDFFTPGPLLLWLLSIWLMAAFHGLLFLDDIRLR